MTQDMLNAAALSFRDGRPTDLYPANTLFAVRFADGVAGYCCMIDDTNYPTLFVYLGDAGLASYYRLRTLPEDAPAYRAHEAMVRQDCLVCTFDPSDGAPLYRRHRPYTAVQPVTTKRDQERLYGALSAANSFPAFPPEDLLPDAANQTIPALGLTPEAGAAVTLGRVQLPEDAKITADSPLLDPEAAAALAAIEVNPDQELLVELTIAPEPLEGDPPMFPVGLLMVDPQEGIVGMPLVQDYPAEYTELVAGLLSFIMEHGKPYRVQVRDDTTYLLLQNSAQQIGLNLVLAESLPEIELMKISFYEGMKA